MSDTPSRDGSTLFELILTLVMLGIVAALAVPSARTVMDRLGVRAATHDVVLALWAARNVAAARGEHASVVVDAAAGRVRVVAGGDIVFARDIRARHGVTVSVTRDSITYAPTGIGYGAANTRIIVSRGRRADTVTTSRLGRVAF